MERLQVLSICKGHDINMDIIMELKSSSYAGEVQFPIMKSFMFCEKVDVWAVQRLCGAYILQVSLNHRLSYNAQEDGDGRLEIHRSILNQRILWFTPHLWHNLSLPNFYSHFLFSTFAFPASGVIFNLFCYVWKASLT